MLALAFSFLVFAYWTSLGRAVVALAYPRIGALRAWLLAPAIGLSVILLGLMFLNQAGVPIGQFATPLTVLLGIAAIAVLGWTRPVTPWKKLAPYFLAVMFACVWTAWPAIQTGFNWISYANDDMANYCLAAQRFMDHGFYSVPTLPELGGRDYASYYFFMHVADMMRFGAEHIVAWSACVAHAQATQGFMPAIVALGLVQITSAGALVLQQGRWRRRALITVWLLAASPLFMLGTLYQLIAQVGGVALLLTTLALLVRPWATLRRRTLIRYAILPAITAAALCIFYPEVTPFVGLAFVGYAVVWATRHRAMPDALIVVAAYTLLGAFVLLRHNVISYVSILVVQFNGAMQSSNLLLSLFPYFMLPTGFSNLFGWMPIAHDFPEPALSTSIALGMLLMVVILLRSLRDAWRLSPTAILLLIQFFFAVRLFDGANDFGLYKLAMWMQPALAAGFAGLVLSAARQRLRTAGILVAVYALTAAPTALYYTNASRGVQSGGLTELRMASQLGLKPKLPTDKNLQLTGTIENVVAAKLAASELRGYPLELISRDFFDPTTRTDFVHPTWPVLLQPHYRDMAQALPLIKARNKQWITDGMLWDTQFKQPIPERPTDYYVSLDPELSLFNKFDLPTPSLAHDGVFMIEPTSAVHNRLAFVHSGLGNHYYLGDRRRISFFQQEPDLFAPGKEFNGIGRFMLLRIENASPKIYLRIAATRTLATGRTAWNPRAKIHAMEDKPLGAVGNGAFNLFIGPLEPRPFAGTHYVAIDFAEYPQQLFDYRTGLKRLYNQKVFLDYRRLLGWARDISAISEDEYASLQRPRGISKFPSDLANAHALEFAGAYEDGWLSSHARFVFAAAKPGDLIRFRGFVPQLGATKLGSGVVHVAINGQPVCDLPMPLGRFDWLLPVTEPLATTTVDLQFTATADLPGRDRRPIAAKVEYLGFADLGSAIDCDFDDASAPRLAAVGIDQDGWARRNATLLVPGNSVPRDLTIRLESPAWARGATPGMLHVLIGGTALARDVPLTPGQRPTVQLRLPASREPLNIELHAPREFQLPAPDGRERAYRITEVHVAPVTPQ